MMADGGQFSEAFEGEGPEGPVVLRPPDVFCDEGTLSHRELRGARGFAAFGQGKGRAVAGRPHAVRSGHATVSIGQDSPMDGFKTEVRGQLANERVRCIADR